MSTIAKANEGGSLVQLFVTGTGDDLAEAISEQMLALNRRWWDESDDTCERVLAWLYGKQDQDQDQDQ